MPRSILAQKPIPALEEALSPSRVRVNFCWFMAVGASSAASTPRWNQSGAGLSAFVTSPADFDLWVLPCVWP